jgi:hypothetical protein
LLAYTGQSLDIRAVQEVFARNVVHRGADFVLLATQPPLPASASSRDAATLTQHPHHHHHQSAAGTRWPRMTGDEDEEDVTQVRLGYVLSCIHKMVHCIANCATPAQQFTAVLAIDSTRLDSTQLHRMIYHRAQDMPQQECVAVFDFGCVVFFSHFERLDGGGARDADTHSGGGGSANTGSNGFADANSSRSASHSLPAPSVSSSSHDGEHDWVVKLQPFAGHQVRNALNPEGKYPELCCRLRHCVPWFTEGVTWRCAPYHLLC